MNRRAQTVGSAGRGRAVGRAREGFEAREIVGGQRHDTKARGVVRIVAMKVRPAGYREAKPRGNRAIAGLRRRVVVGVTRLDRRQPFGGEPVEVSVHTQQSGVRE